MADSRRKLKVACPNCRQKLDISELTAFSTAHCPVCGTGVIVPKLFGQFCLEEKIGSGRATEVYRALDPTLDREVAVKFLHEEFLEGDEGVILTENFLKQGRRAAGVNHANVVPIYSCGTNEGVPYLVMQYMGGGTLADRVAERGALPVSYCLHVAKVVSQGLAAAHGTGVFHHNVTPRDIFVDQEGNVKIGDFALVRILYDQDNKPVRGGMISSRANCFLSPEQVEGSSGDHLSDIYGLGASLYYLLTGHLPFGGSSPREAGRARAAGAPLVSPREHRGGLPVGIGDLILDMMSSKPGNRPGDCGELARRFEGFSDGTKVASPGGTDEGRSGESGRRAVFVSATGPGSSSVQKAVKPSKSGLDSWLNRLLILSFVVLLLVTLVAIRRHGLSSGKTGNSTESGNLNNMVEPVVEMRDSPVSKEPDSQIEREKLEQWRVLTRRRPKPSGLKFETVQPEIQEYLENLPQELKALERQRLQRIVSSREYLVQLMKYVPFDDPDSPVELSDGTMLEGPVPYCSGEGIKIRTRIQGQNKLVVVRWEEVPFSQCVRFLDFYMRNRLEQADLSGSRVISQARREASEDCVRLALLCDWYGNSDSSFEYAALAVQHDPHARATLEELLPGACRTDETGE